MRSLFATKLYEAKLGRAGAARRARPFDPNALPKTTTPASPGRRSIATPATPAMRRSTTCRSAIRPSPTSRSCSTRHAATFAKDCAFELARKPKLDSLWVNLLSGRWAPQWTHPSAQHHLRHALRRSARRLGRNPLRGSAPAADDGRADAARRCAGDLQPFVTVEPQRWPAPDVGKLAAARGACRHRQRRAVEHFASTSPKGRQLPSPTQENHGLPLRHRRPAERRQIDAFQCA